MADPKRLELQSELEGYFEGLVANPSLHVSFQPDESSQIAYPHIVYSRSPAYEVRADNIMYIIKNKYEVTYIDREPESPVFELLRKRNYCSHMTSFVADGLHHDVFELYH